MSAINPQVIHDLRQLSGDEGSEFLEEMISLFAMETSEGIVGLERCLQDEDIASLSRISHSLRSTAQNLGAIRLSQLCEDLEMICLSGRMTGLSGKIQEVRAEVALCRQELELYR